jgi:hypothetical protein
LAANRATRLSFPSVARQPNRASACRPKDRGPSSSRPRIVPYRPVPLLTRPSDSFFPRSPRPSRKWTFTGVLPANGRSCACHVLFIYWILLSQKIFCCFILKRNNTGILLRKATLPIALCAVDSMLHETHSTWPSRVAARTARMLAPRRRCRSATQIPDRLSTTRVPMRNLTPTLLPGDPELVRPLSNRIRSSSHLVPAHLRPITPLRRQSPAITTLLPYLPLLPWSIDDRCPSHFHVDERCPRTLHASPHSPPGLPIASLHHMSHQRTYRLLNHPHLSRTTSLTTIPGCLYRPLSPFRTYLSLPQGAAIIYRPAPLAHTLHRVVGPD